jgi:hypothetical protein
MKCRNNVRFYPKTGASDIRGDRCVILRTVTPTEDADDRRPLC